MAHPAERIPHVPGSRYAAELARGARSMRFPPEIEAEYQRFYLNERRSHVRTFTIIMFVLVGLALAASWIEAPTRADTGEHVRLIAIGLAYLAMIWAAYSRLYQRVYLTTANIGAIVISIAAGAEVAHRVSAGQGEMFGFLTVYSLGIYFLLGILYRAALVANVAMVIAFGVALAVFGVPVAKTMSLTALLALTAAIGGVSFRYQGIRFRRAFLAHQLIAEMAARDGLTGLKNRRAFDEHLDRTWQQALRDRRPLVVVLIDVDHFKRYNDRYGHQAGDEALQRLASTVDQFARRPLDLAARYGGEELAMILFDVTHDHAARIAEQVRNAVQNLQIEHRESDGGVVTVSVGVAIIRPTLERSPGGAVQLADEALYAAKRDGRNCVRIFDREYDTLSTGTFRVR
jgi:diguanylate cyclase (GGDEF)-like protein